MATHKGSGGNVPVSSQEAGDKQPQHVLLVDSTGGAASIGGGTQYAENSSASTVTGNVVMWKDSSNALQAASTARPLPIHIVSDQAGSGVDADDGTVAGAQSSLALVIGLNYAWDGSNWKRVEGSTSTPPSTSVGVKTRPVMPSDTSAITLVTSSNSTAVYALVSSVAGLMHRAFAYFVGSTTTLPSTLVFMSSAAADVWSVNFGSGSSGVTGANLAVPIPSWIFKTKAGEALNCRVESGSTGQITRVSLAWFTE